MLPRKPLLVTATALGTAAFASFVPQTAQAQDVISECSQISALFDQSVPPGENGMTRTERVFLLAGDRLEVTWEGANNSFFEVNGEVIISGQAGSFSATFTAPEDGFYDISVDVQSTEFDPSSVDLNCFEAPVQEDPEPETPPAEDPPEQDPPEQDPPEQDPEDEDDQEEEEEEEEDEEPSDPNNEPDLFLDEAAINRHLTTKSNVLANDNARFETSPGALPGTQNSDTQLVRSGLTLEDISVVRGRLDKAREGLQQIVDQVYPPGDPGRDRILSAPDRILSGALDPETAIALLRVTLRQDLQEAAERLAFFQEEGQVDKTTQFVITMIETIVDLELTLNPALNTADGGVSFRNQHAVDPLSFSGSTSNTLRISTRSVPVGDSGQTWLWSDGQIAFLTGSNSRDGHVGSLRVGLVHAVSAAFDIGIYAAYLNAETDQRSLLSFSSLDTEGFGVGGYMKFRLSEDVWGGLSFYVESSDNDANVSNVISSFNRIYASLETEVSTQFDAGNGVKIAPSFTAGVIRSSIDSYVDSTAAFIPADNDIYGTASANLDITRSFTPAVSWANSVTLVGGASLRYTNRPTTRLTTGQDLTDDDLTGALRGSAKFFLNSGAAFDVRLGVNGLGGDTQSLFGGFQWRKNF